MRSDQPQGRTRQKIKGLLALCIQFRSTHFARRRTANRKRPDVISQRSQGCDLALNKSVGGAGIFAGHVSESRLHAVPPAAGAAATGDAVAADAVPLLRSSASRSP